MPRRTDIKNEDIIRLYYENGFNRRQTAEKLNCSQDLIAYRIKQLGLKPKSMSKCVISGKQTNSNLSCNIKEIINGEMLGDGHLQPNRDGTSASFRMSFGFDKKEWANYIIDKFKKEDIPLVGKGLYFRKAGKTRPNENGTWSFATKNIKQLGKIFKKWYIPNKNYNKDKKHNFNNRKHIKIVPNDLSLSKTKLLHWYIGDGSVLTSGAAILSTQCFSWEEVELLRYLLKNYGILTSHTKYNNIYIPVSERINLMKIIDMCPVSCYKYKWDKIKYGSKKTNIDGAIEIL